MVLAETEEGIAYGVLCVYIFKYFLAWPLIGFDIASIAVRCTF